MLDRELIVYDSSQIQRIGWDGQTDTLVVEFINGQVYRYDGVTPMMFGKLASASSVGAMFADAVRLNPAIPYTKLGGWPEDDDE